MRKLLRGVRSWGLGALLVSFAGCATVDPRADYERVGRTVEAAAGQALVYPPGEEAAARAKAAELLAGGVTLQEAQQLVLLNNPQVRSALMRVGMARADVVQAGLWSNPTLGLFFLVPEGGGVTQFELYLAQNIADLWMIPARKRASQRDLDRAIVSAAQEIAALVFDAKTAYFDAVGAERSLDIATENRILAERLTDVTQARLEAGAVSALDVNLARGLALRAQVEERQARLVAANARRTLAMLMGVETPAENLTLVDALPPATDVPIDAERMAAVALQSRLDAQAARDAVRAAEERVAVERARVFNNAEVGLGLQRQAARAQPGRNVIADTVRSSLASGQFSPEVEPRSQRREAKNEQIDTILGPSLNIALPIFDQNQAQIAKAEYALQEAAALAESLERTIVQEARRAADGALTAWSVARLYERELLPQAERTLELSRSAYEAGSTPILNVIDAQRSLLETRQAYVAALQAAATALVELERATSRPAAELLKPPDAAAPTMRPTQTADSPATREESISGAATRMTPMQEMTR
jgi:cobalt-zinc-cadmium efflux system outer membrane protein